MASFQEFQRTGQKSVDRDGLTVAYACNHLLTHVEKQVTGAGRKKRSWATLRHYQTTCEVMVDVLGRNTLLTDLRPYHFHKLCEAIEARKGNDGERLAAHQPTPVRSCSLAQALAIRNC